MFRFLVEERIQCCQTRKVRYTERVDYLMQLPVAMEAATNKGNGSTVGRWQRAPSRVSPLQADHTVQPLHRSARTPSPDGAVPSLFVFPSVPMGLAFETNQTHHRLFEGIVDGWNLLQCLYI